MRHERQQLNDIKDFVTRKERSDEAKPGNEWIDSGAVKRMLNISTRTWAAWRKAGYIPFSQFGNKIYVLKKDLQTFMESNHIKAKIDYIDYDGEEGAEMSGTDTPSRSQILAKTNYGIDIYAHILHRCFPDDSVVISLSGRDCGTCRNPFNGGRKTLKIWIEKSAMPDTMYKEYAVLEDSDGTIPHGDAFMFAKLYYGLEGDELLKTIDRELHLNICNGKGFYDTAKDDGRKANPTVKPIPMFSFYRAPISNVTPCLFLKSLVNFSEVILNDLSVFLRWC